MIYQTCVHTGNQHFNYLCNKTKRIPKNPAQDLENPKLGKRLPRYLTLDQSKELLQTVANPDISGGHGNHDNSERNFAMITILLNCGVRLQELININISDIDFENKTVSINKQITKQSSRENWRFVPPKTKKSNRVLPLTKVLLNDLKTLKESDKEILFGFNDKFNLHKQGNLFKRAYFKCQRCTGQALFYFPY